MKSRQRVPSRFPERIVRTWNQFLKIRRMFGLGWVFRGQRTGRPLATTLERACGGAGIGLKPAAGIEEQLIRDFRRRYSGADAADVRNDKLYCLALMQHHGAPTRLLDFTYSPFVAAYFALERAEAAECVVWCIDGEWTLRECRKVEPKIDRRNIDTERNDATFDDVYRKATKLFVFPDNAILMNQRLIAQQGLFLVPGDVSRPFDANLRALDGWADRRHVVKLRFVLTRRFKMTALDELHAMNITRASLFPGLDGFAQSLQHRMLFYRDLARLRIGERPPNVRLR